MIIFSALIRKNKIQNFIYYYFKLKYKSCFLSAFNELFITKDLLIYVKYNKINKNNIWG